MIFLLDFLTGRRRPVSRPSQTRSVL